MQLEEETTTLQTAESILLIIAVGRVNIVAVERVNNYSTNGREHTTYSCSWKSNIVAVGRVNLLY